MIKKRIHALVIATLALLACGTAYAAAPGELTIGTTKAGATLTVDRIIKDGMALVSVDDAAKQPLLGLGIEDFTVSKGDTKGKVVSVQSIAEIEEVPLHIVMVLDNSSSMEQRHAVKALLAGVDKLLQIIRPIDDVQMVVFDQRNTVKMGGRTLKVRTFKSNNPNELRKFAAKTYRDGMTLNTALYEGILAGLDIIKSMPATDPRFMVVFSDGEDNDSAFKKEEVMKVAKEAGRFNAYVIDYLSGKGKDPFLSSFAAANRGQIWKADSAEKLVPIFESVASSLDYFYILSYVFIPPSVKQPVVMVFPEAALFDFDKAELKPEGKEQIKAYKEDVKSELSRADKIRITGHTDNIGTKDYNMKLSQRRADAVRDYLKSLGVQQNMEAIGEGMSRPIADNRTKEGQAKNRRVEIEVYGIEK